MSEPSVPKRIEAILAFIQAVEPLKDTLRTGVTARGRRESTAEHSWRLCLLAMLFSKDLPRVDVLQLLKLCLIHDLGEVISGDVPAPLQGADPGRAERERGDFLALCALLPDDLRQELLALFDEYAAGVTAEAKAAKGFDKLETMLQHLVGRNAPDFDYRFNLTYGRTYTDHHPLLAAIRKLVDNQTAERLGEGHAAAAHSPR